jgi:hypothetical protein
MQPVSRVIEPVSFYIGHRCRVVVAKHNIVMATDNLCLVERERLNPSCLQHDSGTSSSGNKPKRAVSNDPAHATPCALYDDPRVTVRT